MVRDIAPHLDKQAPYIDVPMRGRSAMHVKIIEGEWADKRRADCYSYLRILYMRRLAQGGADHADGDLCAGVDGGSGETRVQHPGSDSTMPDESR